MPGIAAPLRPIRNLLIRGRAAAPRAADPGPDALRTTLFTADQMRAHGRLLAGRHALAGKPSGDRLLNRLSANAQILFETGRMLAAALAAGRSVTPAGEWLLDNLYLIEQEVTMARRHLPRGYGRELPRLAEDASLYGDGAGRPRVYDLALNAVNHSDGQLATDTLAAFVGAYQDLQPLTLGELWAFPIMLRLALIENLRRAAVEVASAQSARDDAEGWATRMLAVADERPSDLVLVVADLARADVRLSVPFVAELARRLQGRGTALGLPLTWIEQRLADQGRTVEAMLQQDSRTQAGWQLTVANSIGSLRLVGATDWPAFVEAASGVERTLRRDPAGIYEQMDFASRDRYRHAVERLAKLSKRPEADIAAQAIQLAAREGEGTRAAHVGHFVVGAGAHQLWRSLGLRPPRNPAQMERIYLRGGALLTLLLAIWPAWELAQPGPTQLPPWALALLALPLLVSSSALAMALLNWLSTLLVPPHTLPRLEFKDGIAADAPTLVVIPTLLTSTANADALVATLEVHYLANRDPMLRYALLTDLRDAAQAVEPGDDALVEHAAAGIAALNARHPRISRDGADSGDNFFLMHRGREFNQSEGSWIGRERKRGKLAALNALLRGDGSGFARVEGGSDALLAMRYVITLDTDTELPHGSAARMVAAIAHPLQRPQFGAGGIVDDGHAILQPRTAASLPSVQQSRHAALFAGDAGIDPYTRAVSDVYQDLFDEGSYVGKGIYDVDAFEAALHGRLPADRILSHDLIEGCHARAGLLSDVTLFEPAASRYGTEAARLHRWTRGDWQLLPWLFDRVRALPGAPSNPLSQLSRWKLLDNLRRSLVAPSLLLLLLAGWAASADPVFWTLSLLLVLGFVPLVTPLILHALAVLHRWRDGVSDVGDGPPSLTQTAWRVLHRAALLPDEARTMLDAVVRTLWRLRVSRRHLLEWTASAHLPTGAAPGSREALFAVLRERAAGPVFAGVGLVLLGALRPAALVAAAPLLLLWLLSPGIVWWLDQPPRPRHPPLSAADRGMLRLLARRTWAFFEAHVGADDNFLPPDNVQFEPAARVAHRTSPTNIGFSLLAPLAAHDLGYVSPLRVLDRAEAALDTLDQLERYRGHFYNWYDTRTLVPLLPRYVSSVDSGNLAACLLLLRTGLQQMADEPLFGPNWWDGLADTLALAREADAEGHAKASIGALEQRLAALREQPPATLAALRAALDDLHPAAAAVLAAVAGQSASATVRDMATPALHWAGALTRQCRAAVEDLAALLPAAANAQAPLPSLRELGLQAGASSGAIDALDRIDRIGDRALGFTAMDYGFLYDAKRRLLAIGWHADDNRRDAGHYDLLASEARLGVYVAIAQGQLPPQAWFALGRGLSSVQGKPVLLSWSGSMFEYLMPALVMPQFQDTLLETSCRAAVQRQIEDGSERDVPWGVSESGYNATDSALNYQYRAFGVPGLGLKRGLADDLVIAPYATLMALIVEPARAAANLRRLADIGAIGDYGCYEAVDFTPSRLPPGQKAAIVRSHMAHHQGMGLLGLAHVLAGPRMQQRFEADPALRAALPLLHEKSPTGPVRISGSADRAGLRVPEAAGDEQGERVYTSPDTRMPEVQLLSNGRYHVLLTQAGGGSSRWRQLGLTRWREDAATDAWGSWCYLRDPDTGRVWSAAHQPTGVASPRSLVVFSESRAEYRRQDHNIETRTSIAVSPEDDIELRRVRLRSLKRERRRIELTSCLEVSLAGLAEDAQHPAFSKLFVQTEVLPERGAILCRRRPRSSSEHWPWMFHLLVVRGDSSGELSFETDRARFVGRGRSFANPLAQETPGPLSNTAGNVLDAVAAGRCTLVVEADGSRVVDLVTGVADSREQCLALIDKYRDRRLADRVFELAWTHGQVLLRQLEVSAAEAQVFARIAGVLLYSQSTLRADAAVIRQNRRGQSGLWGYSISGDLPIVLLTVSDVRSLALVRQLVLAHAWWRQKGLASDLVIWNEEHDTYRQRLHEQILGIVAARPEVSTADHPSGGIFVRHVDQIGAEDRVLMLSVARAIFSDKRGTLAEQLQRGAFVERRRGVDPLAAARAGIERRRTLLEPSAPARSGVLRPLALPSLLHGNGYGGLAANGRDYVISPPPGQTTPAPWVNVIANPRLGTVVSESGSAYTWFGNAHEYRLTPWHNDPVTDSCGEAIYLRDEDSGVVWSPTALPVGPKTVRARHGFGRSVFLSQAEEIATTLTLFVAHDAPVRFAVLELRNESRDTRRLSVTGYVEWVLGGQRATTAPHVVTERSDASGALLARNAFGPDNGNCVAFFDVDALHRAHAGFTCDRGDFIGRNASLRDPLALRQTRLSGRVGAALDPCAALQVPLLLAPGEVHTVVFRLGCGDDGAEAESLIARYAAPDAWRAALAGVEAQWTGLLGTLQVRTPQPALDALVNGWLVYQVIACRFWARSGYYQSGGAYGFRDQLQDTMALVHAAPGLLREQIVRSAGRQFPEGDVQHWWHPGAGRGVRTHCSDDYLWLPLALVRHWRATGDTSLHDEVLPFIECRAPVGEEEAVFDQPQVSGRSASVYEHARLALAHGLRLGPHGLPFIGTGDWNDGMNRVGHAGKGESVWLAFFLCHVLEAFEPLARRRGDAAFADRCLRERATIAASIDLHAWDGAWYRRAWFDDGSLLGSAESPECSIDLIAQSWAVLSGVAPEDRARQAMDSAQSRLVDRDAGIVRLLDPPFDGAGPDPGYIAGYVPGVRENGGQYTHGAIWAAMALAEAGRHDDAWEIFGMINPLNHARDAAAVQRYKVEPWVVSADVYGVAPHTGRGGWSWYTGSAGWMYRLLVETLLGITREVDGDGQAWLCLNPKLPRDWPGFSFSYRVGSAGMVEVKVERGARVSAPLLVLDGRELPSPRLPLADDGARHLAVLTLPA